MYLNSCSTSGLSGCFSALQAAPRPNRYPLPRTSPIRSLAWVSWGSAGLKGSPVVGASPRSASTLATPSRSIQLRICRVLSAVFAHVRCAIASMWYWRLMRVTSSRVFSPVRTRYVTETQSGACPARAAIVRSSTSTSLSSRGAMNSNEIVGRPRWRRSAIRIGLGSLPQNARVSDATRHVLRVEVFEQSKHGLPACGHPIAQLRNGDRGLVRDDLFDQVDRCIEALLAESNILTDPHDVAALRQGAHDLRGGAGLLHRLRQRRRRNPILVEQPYESRVFHRHRVTWR